MADSIPGIISLQIQEILPEVLNAKIRLLKDGIREEISKQLYKVGQASKLSSYVAPNMANMPWKYIVAEEVSKQLKELIPKLRPMIGSPLLIPTTKSVIENFSPDRNSPLLIPTTESVIENFSPDRNFKQCWGNRCSILVKIAHKMSRGCIGWKCRKDVHNLAIKIAWSCTGSDCIQLLLKYGRRIVKASWRLNYQRGLRQKRQTRQTYTRNPTMMADGQPDKDWLGVYLKDGYTVRVFSTDVYNVIFNNLPKGKRCSPYDKTCLLEKLKQYEKRKHKNRKGHRFFSELISLENMNKKKMQRYRHLKENLKKLMSTSRGNRLLRDYIKGILQKLKKRISKHKDKHLEGGRHEILQARINEKLGQKRSREGASHGIVKSGKRTLNDYIDMDLEKTAKRDFRKQDRNLDKRLKWHLVDEQNQLLKRYSNKDLNRKRRRKKREYLNQVLNRLRQSYIGKLAQLQYINKELKRLKGVTGKSRTRRSAQKFSKQKNRLVVVENSWEITKRA